MSSIPLLAVLVPVAVAILSFGRISRRLPPSAPAASFAFRCFVGQVSSGIALATAPSGQPCQEEVQGVLAMLASFGLLFPARPLVEEARKRPSTGGARRQRHPTQAAHR
eukprot:CAMPEP_0170381274 /NCGR_PEP_ID=MMETSP0117_2-20130122/14322_1 /TAXON_ID=400756 /ORGANISM="Durinskia baltica, Strain CSIRO CS-38" /LENGTH=108 /DNA_ID=CAMNT_0010636835 /DNA_START=117 /DNA_END=439 /DNA_ORIENTATION=-